MGFFRRVLRKLDEFDQSTWPRRPADPNVAGCREPVQTVLESGYEVRATPLGVVALTWPGIGLIVLLVVGAAGAPGRVFAEVWPPILALVCLVVIMRASRARLTLRPQGVVVRDPWLRFTFAWEEIELITWNQFNRGRLGRARCVAFWLRDRDRPATRWFGRALMPRLPGRVVLPRASILLSPSAREELICVLRNVAALHGIPLRLAVKNLRSMAPGSGGIPPRPGRLDP
jgi:hypothetical protein